MLLYCHYDVQPPLGEDAWDVPVFELTERDGRWYGRGSADCKGNIDVHLTGTNASRPPVPCSSEPSRVSLIEHGKPPLASLSARSAEGSIPLCNVLADAYPDAEIMLLGVEEPRCLIHAPIESVDPSEIEHLALSERSSSRSTARDDRVHHRRLRGADAARRRRGRTGAAADESFLDIVQVQFAGRTENEVAADLTAALRAHGHSQVDFTVVGSGPNGANPHHEAGERTIQQGDMVVLDFGGLKDGYGSDTTRTVRVGEPTEEEREVFEIVRRAQQAGFEAVRPGVPCEDIDRAARKVIADAGYGDRFIHRVGITTHEPPYMVEDIVVATDDGGRRLNNTSHDLHIVA